jgi:hypothetical protein
MLSLSDKHCLPSFSAEKMLEENEEEQQGDLIDDLSLFVIIMEADAEY